MSQVIVTALLTIGAVAAALMVITTLGPSINASSSAVMESSKEGANRIKTNVEIIAVTVDTPGTLVEAWVKNVGMANISPIDKSDVFVITPGTKFVAATYDVGAGPDTWKQGTPVLTTWNRGDTLHIEITLSAGNALGTGDHVLRVSTRNGIISDMTFSK